MPLQRIPIDKIQVERTQARDNLNVVNVEVLVDYAMKMKAGVNFPAPDVFIDEDGNIYLGDGRRRLEAAKHNGESEIECLVRKGTLRDALLFAVGANSEHGLHRTNADKRVCVLRLLNDSEWGRWSDNEIAKRCCVSHTFVANVRASLTSNVASDVSPTDPPTADPPTREYITKHGTKATMKTEAIGKRAKPYVAHNGGDQETMHPSPEATDNSEPSAPKDDAGDISKSAQRLMERYEGQLRYICTVWPKKHPKLLGQALHKFAKHYGDLPWDISSQSDDEVVAKKVELTLFDYRAAKAVTVAVNHAPDLKAVMEMAQFCILAPIIKIIEDWPEEKKIGLSAEVQALSIWVSERAEALKKAGM
ncbi:MAG: ParB N-terminal domain-containing protein [Candidatus Sumerlaeota bacterium]|nr:ParB N-terminal domain-containing protein [Candidatus Sumerlaeota bacterium]